MKKENYPLIQTDKGQYKAKDDVKFRVLLVDHDLKPSEIKTIEELWVEDPRNRRIVQCYISCIFLIRGLLEARAEIQKYLCWFFGSNEKV